ncbi:MAG: MTH1187 family thiamine-binding protein [Alicyclobacillus sp.]|nr:MTH1187 family thiamine-binding protein [Alicyclobacillus sp.]
MAIVAVSIVPVGTGSTSVSEYVAEAERVLERYPNLRHRLDPMFTNIEGDLREAFAAIADMHDALAAKGLQRFSTVVKIDDRRDSGHTMEEKIAAVEAKLGQTAKTP